MAPQVFKKYGFLSFDHHRLASCTSNGIDSKQVLGSSRTHVLFVLSTGTCTKRHTAPETISMLSRLGSGLSNFLWDTEFAEQPHLGRRNP